MKKLEADNKPIRSMSLTKNLKERLYEKGMYWVESRLPSRHTSIGQEKCQKYSGASKNFDSCTRNKPQFLQGSADADRGSHPKTTVDSVRYYGYAPRLVQDSGAATYHNLPTYADPATLIIGCNPVNVHISSALSLKNG